MNVIPCNTDGVFILEAKEDKDEKLYRIEIQDADGTNIVTLEEQSEMGDFFVDDDTLYERDSMQYRWCIHTEFIFFFFVRISFQK